MPADTTGMPVQTVSEQTYRTLRHMVMEGELAPGQRLVQRTLAARLGVSSIPVIEATRRLERDGLVETLPNSGARVRQWSQQDLEDAYRLREALEGMACRLFVERAGLEQKELLVALAAEFARCVRTGDAEGWYEADLALHAHIVRSAFSKPLQMIFESSNILALTLGNAHKRRYGSAGQTPRADTHDELLAALLGSDADVAEEVGARMVRAAFQELWEQTTMPGGA